MWRRVFLPLLMTLCLLAGCVSNPASGDPSGSSSFLSEPPEVQTEVYEGKVFYKTDEWILLGSAGDDTSGELYLLTLAGLEITGADEVKAGDLVALTYEGGVQETYPAGFAKPLKLDIQGTEDNLVGFYLQIIDDLFKEDEALNDGIETLVFDLNEASNLSAAERSAVLYVAGLLYQVETREGTYEQLCDEGAIRQNGDSPLMAFEKGLLVAFSDMAFASEDTFTFSVQKWRSSLGAYIFTDCEAARQGNEWSYTVGATMIS